MVVGTFHVPRPPQGTRFKVVRTFHVPRPPQGTRFKVVGTFHVPRPSKSTRFLRQADGTRSVPATFRTLTLIDGFECLYYTKISLKMNTYDGNAADK